MARGLDKTSHDKADVSMDITFVREVPNGTGWYDNWTLVSDVFVENSTQFLMLAIS